MSLCELCISALPWKSRIHENEHPVACCSRCFTCEGARAGGDEWGRGRRRGYTGEESCSARAGGERRGARGVTAEGHAAESESGAWRTPRTSAVEHHALMMKRWLPGSTTTLMVGARARR